MTGVLQGSGEKLEPEQLGSIESLQAITRIRPPGIVMDREDLIGWFEKNSIVEAIASAVYINNLDHANRERIHPRQRPGAPQNGALEQAFHCIVRRGVDDQTAPLFVGGSSVELKGVRKNLVNPDKAGPFDYSYHLRLPVKDYLASDFRVDPEGLVDIACSSSILKTRYRSTGITESDITESRDEDRYIGSEDLASVLLEGVGDVVRAIQSLSLSEADRSHLLRRKEMLIAAVNSRSE